MVSVIITTLDDELWIEKSLSSIQQQTTDNIETIVLDRGSSDKTIDKIKAIKDCRIRLLEGKCSYAEAMNIGVKESKGDYLVFLNVGDWLVAECLELKSNWMELRTEITISGHWTKFYGDNAVRRIAGQGVGTIKNPLIQLLSDEGVIASSAMLRKSFLTEHRITLVGDENTIMYRLMCDIALKGGIFYIDPYALVLIESSRLTTTQRSPTTETTNTFLIEIQTAIVNSLITQIDKDEQPYLHQIYSGMQVLYKRGKIGIPMIGKIMQRLLAQID